MIDFKKVRIGDYLTVRMQVVETDIFDTDFPFLVGDLENENDQIWVYGGEIVGHEATPRPLEAGDVVTYLGGDVELTIKAIVGDYAWVYSDRTDNHVLLLDKLILKV